MTAIFKPLSLRGMALKNRIVMSPMLMYAGTDDGLFSDLHFAHYAARLLGGVGMVMTEVVAVEPRGRISHKDLGLWTDDQIEGLSRLTSFARRCGAPAALARGTCTRIALGSRSAAWIPRNTSSLVFASSAQSR